MRYRGFALQLASGRIRQTLSQLTQGIDEEVRRTVKDSGGWGPLPFLTRARYHRV